MLSTPLARIVPVLLGALLAVAAAGRPAHADVLLLVNGNIVYGQLDAAQLSVVTPDGVVQVDRNDLAEVTLGTVGGDVLRYRNGTAVSGVVDQPSYAVRLPSGQTLVIERERLSVLRFPKR